MIEPMVARLIDGKSIAAEVRQELKIEVEKLKENGLFPGIAVIMVGDNPASQLYVNMKVKAAEEIGLHSVLRLLPKGITQEQLMEEILNLNQDPQIHGFMVQLPLPEPLLEKEILEAIHPAKDVDCFHPYNVGRLLIGEPGIKPCTPLGCITLLERIGIEIEGKKAVVVGRSNIVGKPVATMLMHRNATVTICHSRTRDLTAELQQADIVVAAIGSPQFITGDMLKPGAVVIDVGMNRLPNGKVVGDVDFLSASAVAGWITPVPGGVGPMTIAMLMKNTVEAAKGSCLL
jgi:methylenetetrahydrofolate dehydrogenase (NADP+)/methenyltetrahydrofolate cyclohydrolase